MGTYDWMELQTLTNDIAAARARLAAARATKDIGKARGLEEEIARAEAQRDRLLAHITTNLVSAPEPAAKEQQKAAEAGTASTIEPPAPGASAIGASPVAAAEPAASPESETLPAAEVATPEEAAMSAAAVTPEDAEPAETATPEPAPEASVEQPSPETAERVVATGAAPPAPAPQAAGADGGTNMWDQLKPSDIERAKQDLVTRRAEIIARHAEELRGLDADQAQLDTLEQAITAFLQKFTSPTGAGVVKLDAERELRQTAG
jgi:hypothetical protein